MHIGLPKEIKIHEYRVAITPDGVRELVKEGHSLHVEENAGIGSGFSNEEYLNAGAFLLSSAQKVFNKAELIVKVKEPLPSEYPLFRKHQLLFTYLHLAANKTLTQFLLDKEVTAYAYETLKIDKRLPLLEPMSEVAGKMSALMGAFHLSAFNGGSGVLMGGVVGTHRAKVMVLGGGVAGKCAAQTASGMGADVSILDVDMSRLHYLNDVMDANVVTFYSSQSSIEKLLPTCDIIIGTVLIAGAKAPKLITKEMLKMMKKGSVLVDVAIDQGGCFETSHPTSHDKPTFIKEGIIHYCVANMPGAYPRTSTVALSNVTLNYIKELAKYSKVQIEEERPTLYGALNTAYATLYNEAVARTHSMQDKLAP